MYYRRKHQRYYMKHLLIILLLTGLAACKTTSVLPEGWVKDPFKECAPEEQVIALFTARDWVLDKIEGGDLEQSEIDWLQYALYGDPEITPVYMEVCFTLETYPNKNNRHLVEISNEQVFYEIQRPKYFIYHLISSERLVDHTIQDVYLYYTGKPRKNE